MRLHWIAVLLLSGTSMAEVKFEKITSEVRDKYLERAQVWRQTDIPAIDILAGPKTEIAVSPDSEVPCRYIEPKKGGLSGAVPKFQCETMSGEKVRVKFGRETNEVYGEIVASRLLWALGFYADTVYPVQIKCLGCPEKNLASPEEGEKRLDRIIKDAIIELEFPGVIIEESEDQGWRWTDLEKVKEESGGAPHSQIDALKLLAVFIQHGDVKSDNQRLACYNEDMQDPNSDGVFSCSRPILMIQDLGATFGSGVGKLHVSKFDFDAWESQEIWNKKKEAESVKENNKRICFGNLTSSKPLTERGLDNPQISEQGRQFLAGLLNQLTAQQIKDLFRVARVERLGQYTEKDGVKRLVTADDWANAFIKKRAEINQHECSILVKD